MYSQKQNYDSSKQNKTRKLWVGDPVLHEFEGEKKPQRLLI